MKKKAKKKVKNGKKSHLPVFSFERDPSYMANVSKARPKTKPRPKKKVSRYKLTMRTKLSEEQFARAERETGKAETHAYIKQGKEYKKTLRSIRGLAKLWRAAKKYVLFTDQLGRRLYISDVDKVKFAAGEKPLTFQIKEALPFAHGFDKPEMKQQYWQEITGLKFLTLNI